MLQALGAVIPELWGGSADLAGSNNTTIDKTSSFLPADNPLPEANPYGRTIHFGIREHSMGAELNGITLHGNTRAYGGTFLVFSDYMRNAVRLSALMHLPVTYVWTHDSIGLGEDGPTHQPVEHLASLRAIPGLNVIRPADANETAIAWREVLRRYTKVYGEGHPHGFALTRQGVPTYDANEDTAKGGYVLFEASTGTPEVILIGTGSEVHLAVEAREQLEAEGVPTRVVHALCGVVRGAGQGVPGQRAAAVGQGAGRGRGRYRSDLVPLRRGRRSHRFPGALRGFRRRQGALPGVRLHCRECGRQGQGIHRRRPELTLTSDT